MKNIKTRLVIDIILLILLFVFVGQNLETVIVRFTAFTFGMPLVILIVIVFSIGFYTAKAFNKK